MLMLIATLFILMWQKSWIGLMWQKSVVLLKEINLICSPLKCIGVVVVPLECQKRNNLYHCQHRTKIMTGNHNGGVKINLFLQSSCKVLWRWHSTAWWKYRKHYFYQIRWHLKFKTMPDWLLSCFYPLFKSGVMRWVKHLWNTEV